MSCASGLLTTTCGSAAGGAPAELPLALGEYLSQTPKNPIPASPAATHSLADARPLIRRPLFSTRSQATSVPVSILEVLRIVLLTCTLTKQKSQRVFCRI